MELKILDEAEITSIGDGTSGISGANGPTSYWIVSYTYRQSFHLPADRASKSCDRNVRLRDRSLGF